MYNFSFFFLNMYNFYLKLYIIFTFDYNSICRGGYLSKKNDLTMYYFLIHTGKNIHLFSSTKYLSLLKIIHNFFNILNYKNTTTPLRLINDRNVFIAIFGL